MVASRKEKSMKVYKRPFLITIVISALMMQVILEKNFGLLGYMDELAAVVSIIYIINKTKLKFSKELAAPLFIIGGLILLGGVETSSTTFKAM